jgi:FkbM family methyltransferase
MAYLNLNLLRELSKITRWLQSRQPNRPLRGLTRLGTYLNRFAAYNGVVEFPDGTCFRLDSHQPAERWLMLSGNYQPAVTDWLKHHTKTGDYCLDIGGNLGFYTIKLGKWVSPSGKVAAFEANPAMVKRIQDHIDLNNFAHVHVIDKAVDNEIKVTQFYISVDVENDPGKNSLFPEAVHGKYEGVDVPTVTIDTFMAESGWDRLDVIKMDIEGNDCHALLGAKETFARFRPFLVFEYSAKTPPEIASAAISMLQDLGYHLQILHPNGDRSEFQWSQVKQHHVDVVCEPPSP